jgi:hypothetical protein
MAISVMTTYISDDRIPETVDGQRRDFPEGAPLGTCVMTARQCPGGSLLREVCCAERCNLSVHVRTERTCLTAMSSPVSVLTAWKTCRVASILTRSIAEL